MDKDVEEMGPIDYIVIEFPGNKFTGEAFPALIELVDRGLIRILDLMFIRKDLDGSTTALTIQDLSDDDDDDGGDFDVRVFEGASSGLLGDDDITEAAEAIDPGSSAGLLIYENVWAAPFAVAVRRSGGQLVASGRIPVQAIIASLDALEADESGAESKS
ncbi:MAG: DUF6325 family protein [Dermatophilaceae bacterium]